jgi:hypothetical protein
VDCSTRFPLVSFPSIISLNSSSHRGLKFIVVFVARQECMISPFNLGHKYEYGTEFEVRGYSLRSSYHAPFLVITPNQSFGILCFRLLIQKGLGPLSTNYLYMLPNFGSSAQWSETPNGISFLRLMRPALLLHRQGVYGCTHIYYI